MACARSAWCAPWPPASITAIAIGTLAVDHAEPPRSAPTCSTGCPSPTPETARPLWPPSEAASRWKPARSAAERIEPGFAGARCDGFPSATGDGAMTSPSPPQPANR